MAGIIFKLTDAGRQALVNAQQNGTQARTLVSVGVTAVAFTPTALLAAVPNELKRLAAIAGDVVAKDTIHVTIRDDGTGTYSVRGLGLYLDNGVLLGTYSQPAVIVEKSANSILLLATDLRVLDGGVDISTLQFGETNFINPPATTERQGVVELATLLETATGTDAVRAVTPAGLKPLLDSKQPLDATLTALAGVNTVADRLIYATGVDQFAVTPLTAFIRTLLDDADAATARNTLGAAPLASPGLTGTPTAPTAAVGTSTTQLATTAFVIGQAGTAAPKMDAAATVGTATRFAREDHVHPIDTSRAPLASPGLTGTPTAPTAADGTNTTQLASTAFVQNAVGGYLAKGVTGGTVTLTEAEASNPVIALTGALTSALNLVVPVTVKRIWAIFNSTTGAFGVTVKTAAGTGVAVAQGKRNLVYTDGTNVYDGFNDFDNIAITGTSTAPTAAVGTNTTQLATTAFVIGQAGTAAPKIDGAATVGTATRFAREDHVHPTDTSRASLASPGLTGTPTAPTAAAGTNNTQIATTAFVVARTQAASETASGVIELATTAEVKAGSDLVRAVTPKGLADTLSDHVPTGTVIMFSTSALPAGYLKCDGSAVSRTTYAKLFAVLGTLYGAGNGSSTFNLPDLRGEFPRFWDDARGVDPSRACGSWQTGTPVVHDDFGGTDSFDIVSLGDSTYLSWDAIADKWVGTYPLTMYASRVTSSGAVLQYVEASSGGFVNMARPRNVALFGVIKYL
ncbi:tail fiber protein [Comamonas testosteroni]|uniref:tail fiber protein n=1 Tax=Comamonas testosteroni TaxID=285 RepID=UPI0026ED1CB9|nr:tail fiber protein [Comamonas testosteroni]